MQLAGSDWEALRQWEWNGNAVCLAVPQQAVRLASDAFLHFWRARPNLHAHIPAWTSETPPFACGSCGSWLRGRFIELPDSRSNSNDRVGWHGTCFHYLERIATKGLANGWSGVSVNGVRRQGIYYHVLERAHNCLHYLWYSALEQDSGFLFAPVVQLRAPDLDPRQRKQHVRRLSGRQQELTYQDVCVITDVWVHIRHVLELYSAPRHDMVWAEGRFEQSLEADAMLPRKTLERRAEALCREG